MTRVLRRGTPAYPAVLEILADPPGRLHVRGHAALLGQRAVALVGTRVASPEGEEWTYGVASRLAEAGFVVASGLARGIDAAAHRGALAAGGDTVAVLGCGVDVPYPPEHAALQEEIAAEGALVSEHPDGVPPRPWHFPQRNRILAALVEAVVVVESRARSGALITARQALELGREVFVVPGWPASPLSAGPLALLRDGARPVRHAADLLEDLGGIAAAPRVDAAHADALAAVEAGAADPADLARRLGIPLADARERWAALELLGRLPKAAESA